MESSIIEPSGQIERERERESGMYKLGPHKYTFAGQLSEDSDKARERERFWPIALLILSLLFNCKEFIYNTQRIRE